MFTILPFINFTIIERFSSSIKFNIDIMIYYNLLYIIGGRNIIYYELGVIFVSSLVGAFLFHVQHTYENVKKFRTDNWNNFETSIYGSSYFVIPWYLKFFTANIEYHHIHHLNPKIPCYWLSTVHNEGNKYNYWKGVKNIHINDIPKLLNYTLYDEQSKKLV